MAAREQLKLKSVIDYLKSHDIKYVTGVDNGHAQVIMEFEAENAPDKYIEACAWFYTDVLEARAYYTALGSEVCQKNQNNIDQLLKVLNFINARVFLSCRDQWNCEPRMLYTPRIYITEDNHFDITITTMIPYDFFDRAKIETLDYLTGYCPELLDRLSLPIYGVLLGNMSADSAIAYIKNELLREPEEEKSDEDE